MPSLWEEWGLVVNEALACSTPVIVSVNAGCAEDLVIDGVTGFKIDPKNTPSITHAMKKIADKDVDRKAMGHAGRELVQQFDCAHFGENAVKAIEYTATAQ
jgi:glycosyltransferase involved in cell wall biosynthesis